MTVRANKPAFSIREKLKELQKPIGLKGSELMRTETAQDARDLVSAGRKNLIINGAMQVAQRGTSVSSVTTSGYRAVDRFQTTLNGLGTWTVSRETDAPDDFKYSLKHTCTTADASPASADYAIIYHKFETQNIAHLNYGSSAAQDVTLSFWVKSNKTGNASVGIWFSGGGDNRFLNIIYTINSSDTWEHKTVTFNGNTDFSFGAADNDMGLTIEWWMNSGSSFQGNTENTWTIDEGRNVSNLGIGGATSDYFSLTGVQLEVGKNATEFEHRSYGEELALCQRYFRRITPVSNGAGGGWTDNYYRYGFGVANATNNVHVQVVHPVTMRSNAIFTHSGASDFNLWNGTFYAVTGIGFGSYGATGAVLSVSATVPDKQPFELIANNRQTGYLDFNAEL